MKENPLRGAGSRIYRVGIYCLLATMVVLSVGISAVVSWTTDGVRKSATPLLRQRIPMLNHLAEFDSSVLRHQLAMNKFFARSVSYERLLFLENETTADLRQELQLLGSDPSYNVAGRRIREGVEAVLALTPRFNEAARGSDPKGARAILQDLNDLTNQLRIEITDLQKSVETEVDGGSEQATLQIDQVRSAVHAVNLITAIGALFMIYQMWALLRSERRLAYQSMHDPLTGLPHRRSLERHLEAATDREVTLLLGRVDRFERVAASMGHSNADRLLRDLAARLSEVVAPADGHAFRLDGALIAVLLEGSLSKRGEGLERLREQMAEAFHVERHEVFLTLSIGSVETSTHRGTPDTMLRMAAAALQVAERRGGNQAIAYSQDLRLQTMEQVDMEADLQHALERGQLEVHYQPQQDLRTGNLTGFEALLRWNRDMRRVSPAEFIPLAEESGLIVPIGAWVFEQACLQAKIWNRGRRSEITVAVNVAMQQFQHPGFIEMVQGSLARTGVNPRHLQVELTESTAMEEPIKVQRVLTQLRSLGITLAMDDFGTGYSSLSYLRSLPLDKLKIDQSFIRAMATEGSRNEACIVRAVIDLAHNLELTVLAEGVETIEQCMRLTAMGCDEIQGYLFGKPLPAAQLDRWLYEGGAAAGMSMATSQGDVRAEGSRSLRPAQSMAAA